MQVHPLALWRLLDEELGEGGGAGNVERGAAAEEERAPSRSRSRGPSRAASLAGGAFEIRARVPKSVKGEGDDDDDEGGVNGKSEVEQELEEVGQRVRARRMQSLHRRSMAASRHGGGGGSRPGSARSHAALSAILRRMPVANKAHAGDGGDDGDGGGGGGTRRHGHGNQPLIKAGLAAAQHRSHTLHGTPLSGRKPVQAPAGSPRGAAAAAAGDVMAAAHAELPRVLSPRNPMAGSLAAGIVGGGGGGGARQHTTATLTVDVGRAAASPRSGGGGALMPLSPRRADGKPGSPIRARSPAALPPFSPDGAPPFHFAFTQSPLGSSSGVGPGSRGRVHRH